MTHTDDAKALRALVERAWDLLVEFNECLVESSATNGSTSKQDENAMANLVRWQTDARDAGVWRDA